LSPQNRDVEGGLVKEAPASKKFSVRSLLSK
jgi:hypothetical protein